MSICDVLLQHNDLTSRAWKDQINHCHPNFFTFGIKTSKIEFILTLIYRILSIISIVRRILWLLTVFQGLKLVEISLFFVALRRNPALREYRNRFQEAEGLHVLRFIAKNGNYHAILTHLNRKWFKIPLHGKNRVVDKTSRWWLCRLPYFFPCSLCKKFLPSSWQTPTTM